MCDDIAPGSPQGGRPTSLTLYVQMSAIKTLSNFVTFLLYKYLFATHNFYPRIDFFLFSLKVRYDVVKKKTRM